MTNVELIVHTLENAGVRWVFGIPSGPVLPLIEALRKSSVQFVLTASETSAGFMASTVGYLTGIPGVCASTVGPGATNLTTGVGSAWLDRTPVLAITCNVATSWLERRIQMRIDHHALFKPLTKASFSLRDGRVGETLAAALATASAEPPGPVHIDLPEDVGDGPATPFDWAQGRPFDEAQGRQGRIQSNVLIKYPDLSSDITKIVAAALRKSQRPLLLTGLGFTRARALTKLLRFVETQGIPFVTTLHAKGFLPETHPNWAGVIGRARRSDVKAFVEKADLIVAVGYDPIEINYEEWVGSTPVIHLSTEAAEESDQFKPIWNRACDLDRALERISELPKMRNEWLVEELKNYRETLERSLRPSGVDFAAYMLLDILREELPRDGILAYDVGAHTHQIATQWRTDAPRTLLATNGWSSMGFGMPAAYAAKLVYPERAVVGVVGDGCFQMTVGELAVARRLGLSVPTVVLNDGWLGLMKVKQERKHFPLSGVYLGNPAESPPHYFGVPCRPAKSARAFREALEWAFALGGPSVIEAFIEVEPYSLTVFD